MKPTPEQKAKMLKKLVAYHSRLMDEGYSGTVQERYDRGHLQMEVSQHKTDRLEEVG